MCVFISNCLFGSCPLILLTTFALASRGLRFVYLPVIKAAVACLLDVSDVCVFVCLVVLRMRSTTR